MFNCSLNNKIVDKYVNFVGYYQNVRGLRTKLDILRCNYSLINFDYCIFSETWLTPDFNDTELSLIGYQIFRFDRNENTSRYSRGGGILIAVKNAYASKVLSVPINNIEQLFVLASFGKSKFILGGVYIPPSSVSDIYDNHIRSVEFLRDKYPKYKFIIVGDFNLPSACYDASNFGVKFSSSPQSDSISFRYSFLNFRQHNHVYNYSNTLLDLVFSTYSTLSITLSLEPIVPIDNYHPPLFITSKIPRCVNTLVHKN